jgi:hypothetical protein
MYWIAAHCGSEEKVKLSIVCAKTIKRCLAASARTMIYRNALAAILICVFSGGSSRAETLPFGVFGFPLDISASVKETLLPSGTVVLNDSPPPLLDTVTGESVKLLDISSTGVNASGRSTSISGAFGSALTSADGNGGVGVSQLIFGSPDNSGGDAIRQLTAQSLWTQTFRYDGTFPVDITLHLHIPELQVQLLGVPPRRSGISAAESAEATASVVAEITHPDLTQLDGGRFDYGLRETERQVPSGMDLLNLPDLKVLGQTGSVAGAPVFIGDDFNPGWSLDPVSVEVNLGTLHTGDILSYVYTLNATGTTHGFERGYDAFLGDPFGVDVITDNLGVTVTPADATGSTVPEPTTTLLTAIGVAAAMIAAGRRRSGMGKQASE